MNKTYLFGKIIAMTAVNGVLRFNWDLFDAKPILAIKLFREFPQKIIMDCFMVDRVKEDREGERIVCCEIKDEDIKKLLVKLTVGSPFKKQIKRWETQMVENFLIWNKWQPSLGNFVNFARAKKLEDAPDVF